MFREPMRRYRDARAWLVFFSCWGSRWSEVPVHWQSYNLQQHSRQYNAAWKKNDIVTVDSLSRQTDLIEKILFTNSGVAKL
jgi:hypothetical protein